MVELAPSIDDGCGPAPLPSQWECLRIQICESPPLGGSPTPTDGGTADGGTRDAGVVGDERCVQITLPGGDYDDAARELVVARTSLVNFDARVDPDRLYDIEVTAYTAGGGAVAVGRAPYVRPSEGEVRVRLQRYGFSSCPGPGDGTVVAHRAFGAAVPLPNGDILYLGGATGTNVPAVELIAAARFQSAIQLYDVSTSRFRAVTVPDPAGFLRVMFEARHMATLADGRERIRIFGGFAADSETTVSLRLDDKLGFTPYGTPILPGGGTSPRETLDLLFDPATLEATLELVTGTTITSAGGAAVSEVVDGRVVSVGGIPVTEPALLPEPAFFNAFQVWDAEGLDGNNALDAVSPGGRVGATVTYLSGTSFLSWGGGIVPTPATPTGTEHLDAAGLLINVTSTGATASLVAAPAGIPAVAYHTATRLGADRVLITGGATISSTLSTTTPTIALTPAPAGFTILTRSGASVTATAVGGSAREPTILHTATVLSEVGGVPNAILIVGGAETVELPGPVQTTFWSTDRVGVVRGSGASWTYTEVAQLIFPRFGHTTTVIPGVGVLVSGGYDRPSTGDLQPVGQAELLLIDDLLGVEPPPPVVCSGDASLPDAPRRVDAPIDAGTTDEMDAP